MPHIHGGFSPLNRADCVWRHLRNCHIFITIQLQSSSKPNSTLGISCHLRHSRWFPCLTESSIKRTSLSILKFKKIIKWKRARLLQWGHLDTQTHPCCWSTKCVENIICRDGNHWFSCTLHGTRESTESTGDPGQLRSLSDELLIN